MEAALKLTIAFIIIVYYFLSELKFPVSSLKKRKEEITRHATLWKYH